MNLEQITKRRWVAQAGHAGKFCAWIVWLLLLSPGGALAVPAGCKPPELVINRQHPLIILYGPGSAELTVRCWHHLPAELKPYCVVTMDPPAEELSQRLAGWRRMLGVVQAEGIPIVLQVCGDEAEWTTPLWAIAALLKEFRCIKAVQIVEVRCAYYSRFAGETDFAVPANLRYIGEVLKLCGRYGKHLSLQIQADMVHLGSDRLAGPLREIFRAYNEYFLPQNECIGPSYYSAQTAAWGLWLAGYCQNWGMEPQWWWWTKGESYFIRPGVFGVEAELASDEDRYAHLYRAFILEGALMGATVFSLEPPQDIWHGDGTDERHFDRVIYPTLRQLIEQQLIPSMEEVLQQTKVAYQLKECASLHEYDEMLQDLDLELAQGYLERAAYGAWLPHLMKEMIPDTGGRYYFLPLLPVGTPEGVLQRFEKVIQPGECRSVSGYRELLDRYYPPTENCPTPSRTQTNSPAARPHSPWVAEEAKDATERGRACVLKCGRAIAVMQSRENLFEKQPFAVDLPRWVGGLQANLTDGLRLSWEPDPEARTYRVWKRIEGARVYPEWELLRDNVRETSLLVPGVEHATFAVTAITKAKRRLEGTLNYGEYLLFRSDESPIHDQLVLNGTGTRIEPVSWTDESLPTGQEVWRIFDGVPKEQQTVAAAVLNRFGALIEAYEAKDINRVMSFYDADYRDSNGYSAEYVRRAWQWWYQRTVFPYTVAQIRSWDLGHLNDGLVSFTAWNRFRATIVWDEPFGYHGRVRIPRHDGERVTWTWKRHPDGQWTVLHTAPALPNFGEMLWIGRGHDVKHQMEEFSDTPATHGH